MRYALDLSPQSVAALRSMLGRPLPRLEQKSIHAVVWAGDEAFAFVPDELATPDAEHPYADVDFISVEEERRSLWRDPKATVLAQDCGRIAGVWVGRTCITFTPVREERDTIVLGVPVPESRVYGFVYQHPGRLRGNPEEAEAFAASNALVECDIAVRLQTDDAHSVVLFTQGVGHAVDALLDALLPSFLRSAVEWRQLDGDPV